MLDAEAAGLLALAVLLAIPVPTALARARWPTRDPRVALVCWQAVGLAGGLSLLGAALTLAASNLGPNWLSGIDTLPDSWSHLGVAGWTGAVLAAILGLWLAAAAAGSTARIVLARHAHRVRLDRVADQWPSRHLDAGRRRFRSIGEGVAGQLATPGELRLVDYPTAVAYCLPGLRPRIVVTQGAVTALSRAELDAVLAHEQVHARGHHDLLVQPFIAWQRTFPFLPPAAHALDAVELLVEMLADDGACRHSDPASLEGALRCLGDEHLSLGVGNTSRVRSELAQRTARLTVPPPPLPQFVPPFIYLAAVVLVIVPPILLVLG